MAHRLISGHSLAAGLIGDWASYEGAGWVSIVPGMPDMVAATGSTYSTVSGGAFGEFGNNAPAAEPSVGTISTNSANLPSTAITFALRWRQPAGRNGYDGRGNILSMDYGFGFNLQDTNARAVIQLDAGSGSIVLEGNDAGLGDNAVHTAICTWNGTTVTLYSDSTVATTTPGTGQIGYGGGDLRIGTLSGCKAQFLKVWNRALSPTEVAAVMADPYQMVEISTAPSVRKPIMFVA